MITLLLHIANQEPVKVEVDEMPKPTDVVIIGKNPRERNDKEFPWVEDGVTTVIFPWWRINYVQVLPSRDEDLEFPLPFRTD
ncbi:MAG: hypothetical protein D6712_08090 [Chloroflexi bacterium]|nr:MAG: hypothetical protein D6712_08090 [Chloroflexota bacterium]